MKPQVALAILCKFFSLGPSVFTAGIPGADILAWAQQVRLQGAKYQLTQQQHHFLTGGAW